MKELVVELSVDGQSTRAGLDPLGNGAVRPKPCDTPAANQHSPMTPRSIGAKTLTCHWRLFALSLSLRRQESRRRPARSDSIVQLISAAYSPISTLSLCYFSVSCSRKHIRALYRQATIVTSLQVLYLVESRSVTAERYNNFFLYAACGKRSHSAKLTCPPTNHG